MLKTIDIIRLLHKPAGQGYAILYKNNDVLINNLSLFDIYDYLRYNMPLLLLKTLNEYNQTNIKAETHEQAISVLITMHKDFYQIFKDFVAINKKIVYDIDYVPITDRYIESETGYRLNIFRPKIDINNYTTIDPNEWQHIERIIKNISGSDVNYEFFLNFLAYKLQNPCDVPPCHIIIRDDGGTGKSDLLLGDILENIFNVNIINQKSLENDFNSFMVNSNIVWCEEIEGFEDEKHLKSLTGARFLTLNEKYEKTKKIKNYNNFIIVSNEIKVLKLTKNDRRFSIIGGGKRLTPINNDWNTTIFKDEKENISFFESYKANLGNEIKSFISYLLKKKVFRIDIQTPLNNNLRNELIDINKTSEYMFIDELVELGINDFYNELAQYKKSNCIKLINDLIIMRDNNVYITVTDFYLLYIDYCNINQIQKKLSKKMFGKKIEDYDNFINNFQKKQLKYNGINQKVIQIQYHKNEFDKNIITELMEDLP